MASLKLDYQQRNIINRSLLFSVVVVTIISRWAFKAAELDSFDSINYALAIKNFDMRLHQPQPPGYVFYILVARFFNYFLNDPKNALLLVSAVFSGLAVLALYGFTKEFSGERAGWLAAGILVTSPQFWFFGEISSPYTMDLFFATLLGWACFLAIQERQYFEWVGAVCLGLAGAFRLQTMVFFIPLFLFSIWNRPWKIKLLCIALSQVVFLSFFVPSVMASGGFKEFFKLMTGIIPIFSSMNNLVRSTVLSRFIYNMASLVKGTFATVGELAWLAILFGIYGLWKRYQHGEKKKIVFLGLMLLPIWAVYFLIWAGNPGTFLISLPPFILLAAIGVEWLFDLPGKQFTGWTALSVLVIGQMFIFLFLPERPFGTHYREFDNRRTVIQLVNEYQDKLTMIRQFPAEETLVLAADFRHLQFYLPQYPVLVTENLKRNSVDGTISASFIEGGEMSFKDHVHLVDLSPHEIRYVIFFDAPSDQFVAEPSLVETITLDRSTIGVLRVPDGKTIVWTLSGITMLR